MQLILEVTSYQRQQLGPGMTLYANIVDFLPAVVNLENHRLDQ
jgi:hypothetical protein